MLATSIEPLKHVIVNPNDANCVNNVKHISIMLFMLALC